jgi:hypothetical protein
VHCCPALAANSVDADAEWAACLWNLYEFWYRTGIASPEVIPRAPAVGG